MERGVAGPVDVPGTSSAGIGMAVSFSKILKIVASTELVVSAQMEENGQTLLPAG